MKTHTRKLIVCLRLFILLAAPLFSAENAGNSPVLKIAVQAPVSWNLSAHDRFPELFAASLSDALNREGLSVPATELRSVEDVAKVPFLLKVDVTDWSVGGTGDINCSFIATLKTPQGERRLGEYPATRWAPGVVYANSKRAYYPTRYDPLRALCRDLERSLLSSPVAGGQFASTNR